MVNKTLNNYLRLYMLDQQLIEEMKHGDYYPHISYEQHDSVIHSSHIIRLLDKMQQAEDYIRFVEKAQTVIGEELYELVMNDYFGDKYWYKEKYSSATYYRLKKKAQGAFLSYMGEYNY